MDDQRDFTEESYWQEYCPECDSPVDSRQQHAELHSADFACMNCVTEFDSAEELMVHVAAVHTRRHSPCPHEPGTLYGCAVCESECFCGNATPPGDNPSCCGLAACLPGACHTQCVYCATREESYGIPF